MKNGIAVTVVLVLLMLGIYAIGHQNSSGGQAPAPAPQAGTAALSVSGLRMYAHKDTDHFNDNDHCVSFDKPGNEKPLFVEVDLSNDPGSDPQMDLFLAYAHPLGRKRTELLSTTCKRQSPPTTCKAEFDETRLVKGILHQEWHLGDQPDGVYGTMSELSASLVLKTNSGISGLLPPYIFRNPEKCDSVSVSRLKK